MKREYWVLPVYYHQGYCPTICQTMESAEKECERLTEVTGFEWEIIVKIARSFMTSQSLCINQQKRNELWKIIG